MNSIYLLPILFIALISATKYYELENYSFEKYQLEFNKDYSDIELIHRNNIFNLRLKQIKKHNGKLSTTWKKGVNAFTDRTDEELRVLLNSKPNKRIQTKSKYNLKSKNRDGSSNNSNIDWREKNVITAVKNQGNCGSCWTFAATETVESHNAITHGKLEELSEQQILDCTGIAKSDQCNNFNLDNGCNGGTVENAFDRIIKMGGLSTEWAYPYVSYYGEDFQCNKSKTIHPVVKLELYGNLPSNEYVPTVDFLENQGPLAVSVDATSWFSYESGIFDTCNKTHIDLDHAVQLVGFGTDPKLGQYWIVRNSWGTLWGENGYIRLHKSSEISCGVDMLSTVSKDCSKKFTEEKVCGECGILYDPVYPLVN